jgi:hypothetical protein
MASSIEDPTRHHFEVEATIEQTKEGAQVAIGVLLKF